MAVDTTTATPSGIDVYPPIVASGGGGGISGITVEDEGTAVGTPSGITTINFVGAGVTATGSGATATVTIPGASTGLFWALVLGQ